MTHVITLKIGGTTKRSRFEPKPVSLDWDNLPDASQKFVIEYGLRQYLADAMAGAESQSEAYDNIDERVGKLTSGDLSRTKGEAKAKPDTEESRAIKLAAAFIRDQLKQANAKAEAAQIKEAAQALVEADPAYLKEAKRQLAEEAKLKAAEPSDAAAGVLASILAKVGGNASE